MQMINHGVTTGALCLRRRDRPLSGRGRLDREVRGLAHRSPTAGDDRHPQRHLAWRCRRCTVEWTEGFFIDSPGVDGGVYDIDMGQRRQRGPAQLRPRRDGLLASVFAAGGETTPNSVIRHNVCVNNGRSPKLARRQGDLFICTWENGKLDGVRIHDNTFYWNPPIDAPAVLMDHADFTGSRPNVFEGNLVHSAVPRLIQSNDGLRFDRNLYWYAGRGEPKWSYGGREHVGFPHRFLLPNLSRSFVDSRIHDSETTRWECHTPLFRNI